MTIRLLTALPFAVILATGSALAADAPAAQTSATPAATTTIPMTSMPSTPAATSKTTPATPSMPSTKATMAVSKPAPQHRMASACTLSIKEAEKMLASSKVSADNIAMAWQHLDMAKQNRMSHQASACETESKAAANMLSGKI
jgi:hypothetical protein